MTRLLISVRSAREAVTALAAGAHLIDVKEPRAGSLGPADPAVIARVSSQVAGRVPVSAALGELLEQPLAQTVARAKCVRYAKLGLAGCAEATNWVERWARVLDRFGPTTTPIAVAYADWRRARAPDPWRVLGLAIRLGCGGLLVDTFDKSRGGLLDALPPAALSELIRSCRAEGILVVLAGSLTRQSIRGVLRLAPDYIAVRGAACARNRQARLDGRRVRELVRLVDL